MKIITIEGKEKGNIELPSQFNEEIRPDIIKRAFYAINRRQPYGASPEAGKRSSAVLSRRRKNYRGSYGHGISRVPRKIMSRSGARFNWVGAFAPGTVGGRRAHPPKAEKSWEKKINKKERRKAIRSAISATIQVEIVKARGHIVPNNYPLILENKIESLSKTKDIKDILEKIGLKGELERAGIKNVRAGRGKSRGRKYQRRKGPLIVVGNECELMKGVRNISGIDIVKVNNLNAGLLAPGANPGRLTLWTESAIDKMKNEKLFW